MSEIHGTSVEQSKTGNPSVDATWDTCKLQKMNEGQNEHNIPCMQIFTANSLQSNCDKFEKSTTPEENKTFVWN